MALNAMHAKNMSKTNVYDAFPVHMIHLTIHVYNKKTVLARKSASKRTRDSFRPCIATPMLSKCGIKRLKDRFIRQ